MIVDNDLQRPYCEVLSVFARNNVFNQQYYLPETTMSTECTINQSMHILKELPCGIHSFTFRHSTTTYLKDAILIQSLLLNSQELSGMPQQNANLKVVNPIIESSTYLWNSWLLLCESSKTNLVEAHVLMGFNFKDFEVVIPRFPIIIDSIPHPSRKLFYSILSCEKLKVNRSIHSQDLGNID